MPLLCKKAFKMTIHHGVSLIDRISITLVYSVRRDTTEPLHFAGFRESKFENFLYVHSLSVANSGDVFLSLYLPRVLIKLRFKLVYRLVYRAGNRYIRYKVNSLQVNSLHPKSIRYTYQVNSLHM